MSGNLLPSIDYVIACESVRPEPGNKLNILGFYGVLPRAHIRVADPDWGTPISLVSMVSTHGGFGTFRIQLRIKQADASELLPGLAVEAEPSPSPGNAVIIFQFPAIAFTQEGEHKIEVLVNEKIAYEGPFFLGKGLPNVPAAR